ncbi:zinc ribbon domain-containing protein [Parabacteroides bouchesdurhonensis]|uniref:zinc ribbon domain-containing protein n=1 Tax=Parabacteroides bouchesdurhonensis TaxID=1936995 RepID=UPI000C838542|nr:zinc ribbon domain-containing protein [Parabacteroides bouchesdurhonensis]RHJ90801.1 transcriptional regulator [Bacteroides sp. AM07-16]
MENFCQSCGMPMTSDELFGTNADGSKNNDYCTYCYQQGKFVQDYTMDEMINHCIQFLGEFNKDSEHPFSKEEAIAMMKVEFPKLKRWMPVSGKTK